MFSALFKYLFNLFFDLLVSKAVQFLKDYKEKKEQKKIEEDNLKKIKESKDEQEKLKHQVDLINGRRGD